MYNIFFYNTLSSIVGLLTLLFMGTFVGFLLGLIRYILFSFIEGRLPKLIDEGR